jgi:multiple sugar transport system permease protein
MANLPQQNAVIKPSTAEQTRRRPRQPAALGRGVLLYTFVGGYTLLVILPFLIVISASFHPAGLPRLIPETVTLEHYTDILSNKRFTRALRNSLVVSSYSTVLSVVISGLAGYAFSRFEFLGKRVIMFGMLGVFMIPVSVNVIPLYLMMQRLHWLNTIQGLVIPYQALILPLNIWLLKNFLDTIPVELEEAARVDGATWLGAFWRVTLPLAWPGVAVAVVLAFRFSWNDFVFASTFNSTASAQTWQSAMYAFLGVERSDWGLLTSGVVIGMLPMIILFIVFQRRLIEGLTVGAVK